VLTRIGYLVRNRELGLQYLSQALTLAEKLKLYDNQVEVLNGIAYALNETGQWDQAVKVQERSLQINSRVNSRMSTELNGLGHLYLQRDPTIAASYFHRALVLAPVESESPIVISPHYGLARAYSQQGKLDLAIEHYQQAIAGTESIRSQLASDQLRTTFSGQHQRIYNGLVEALMERHKRNPMAGDDRRAFAVLERAKARSLVEAIAELRLDVRQDVDDDLGQREKQLDARIAELQKRLIQPEVSREERARLQQYLSQAEQEFERLKVEIKLNNPRYAALRYPEPLSSGDTQRLLDDRTAIVAYLVTPESVFAFMITSGLFRTEKLPVSANTVRARVQNYVDLIAEDDEGWQEVSRKLYDELVAPINELLPPEVDRLVIIPDDALHYLAFETLIHDIGSESPSVPRYLLEDFTLSYAPSASVLAELGVSGSTASIAETADVAVFANPTFAPALLAQNDSPSTVVRWLYAEEGLRVTRIPFSATEAKAVKRYAGGGSTIYTGAEASENRVKTDRLDRFRVIHFATHGLISQQMPARSALVLTPGGDEDGFLQVREIYGLKLKSDLVVLSACQTARGQVLAGEGVRGLAQAFLYAGARSVVASLWDVNDERATEFMESFYKNLSSKKSKADALRAAKLELLRQDATASPRYWAAFVLIGDADGLVSVNRGSWFGGWLSTTGIVISIFALLFVLTRVIRGRATGVH
jgi:CHAT domain-containing protein